MGRLEILTLVLFYSFTLLNCTNANKVTPEVQKELDKGSRPNVMVECPKIQSTEMLQSYENILQQLSEQNRNEATARTNLVDKLYQTVLGFLKPVVKLLKNMNVDHQILFISSEIFIPKITPQVINQLVKIKIVKLIRKERSFSRIQPQPPESQKAPEGNNTWNIGLIDARCKEIKNNYGKGVIVAVLDVSFSF